MTATERAKIIELADTFTVNASLFLRVCREKNQEQKEAHLEKFTEHYALLSLKMLELQEEL